MSTRAKRRAYSCVRDPLASERRRGDSSQARARARRRAPLPFGMTGRERSEMSLPLPPLCKGGSKGGLSKSREQSLSHFVTAPFTGFPQKFLNFCGKLQGSLGSGGIPLALISCPPCENPAKILRLFAGALFGRVPSGARREGCKGWRRACMTTLPSALFNRRHLPLHRGGERRGRLPLGGEPRIMRITIVWCARAAN